MRFSEPGLLSWISGPHRAGQPKTPALRTLRKYRAEISVGWSCWLQATPPSSSHSSSSNQLKSQPCIYGEYVGLVFLVTGAVGGFLVWPWYDMRYPGPCYHSKVVFTTNQQQTSELMYNFNLEVTPVGRNLVYSFSPMPYLKSGS